MTRTISSGFRDTLEATQSSEVAVWFATITHDDLQVPIYVNSDIVNYVYGGNTFLGCAFSLSFLTDDEQPPRAQVSIENVDQIIGETIQALADSPAIRIQLLVKSDFDDGDPRVEIGTPTVEVDASNLLLRNVKCDGLTLTGDLYGYDLMTEPYPSIRSTQDRLPGLFR